MQLLSSLARSPPPLRIENRNPELDAISHSLTDSLGTPETSLSGRSTRNVLSVDRSGPDFPSSCSGKRYGRKLQREREEGKESLGRDCTGGAWQIYTVCIVLLRCAVVELVLKLCVTNRLFLGQTKNHLTWTVLKSAPSRAYAAPANSLSLQPKALNSNSYSKLRLLLGDGATFIRETWVDELRHSL